MTESAAVDEVVLRVPARPAYGRIVRVGAAALALRQGMSFTEIDDLRLAIDEAMILLLDGADGTGQIRCGFRVGAGSVELEASRDGGNGPKMTGDATDRFDELASNLLDDYDIDPERRSIRIHKRRAED